MIISLIFIIISIIVLYLIPSRKDREFNKRNKFYGGKLMKARGCGDGMIARHNGRIIEEYKSRGLIYDSNHIYTTYNKKIDKIEPKLDKNKKEIKKQSLNMKIIKIILSLGLTIELFRYLPKFLDLLLQYLHLFVK